MFYVFVCVLCHSCIYCILCMSCYQWYNKRTHLVQAYHRNHYGHNFNCVHVIFAWSQSTYCIFANRLQLLEDFLMIMLAGCHMWMSIKKDDIHIEYKPKFHFARHVSTRLNTFDVSSQCILAVSSSSNSTARHARHDELDWLVSSRVET